MDEPRRDRNWSLYLWGVVVLLTIIFIAQNAQKVTVDFIFSETKTPLIFALLIAAVLGFVIGLGLPRFRRARDRD
jgi:uncharacterized integral membrane protein